jgi:hypothetical protein
VKPMNSLTHQFLRSIGSPFANSNHEICTEDLSRLYYYALKNRMALLYLESLKKLGKLGSLQKEHDKLIGEYAKTEKTIYRVSKMLDRASINYTFFKSIRPYRESTVDVDILVFGSKYEEVIRAMQSAGYKFLGYGPLSTTFRDKEARMDLDIYDEVGVSHIIYLDKDLLTKFVGYRKLSNGDVVRCLIPEADLLAVIAHSVVKEQMYVLSEYYTTLHYLAAMKREAMDSFLSLIDKCRMRLAVKTHLGITALLHHGAHSSMPVILMQLLRKLELDRLELMRVEEMGFNMPYKYHPVTIIKALVEKFGEEKARRSFALQALNMLNPSFASSVVKMTIYHFFRETY